MSFGEHASLKRLTVETEGPLDVESIRLISDGQPYHFRANLQKSVVPAKKVEVRSSKRLWLKPKTRKHDVAELKTFEAKGEMVKVRNVNCDAVAFCIFEATSMGMVDGDVPCRRGMGKPSTGQHTTGCRPCAAGRVRLQDGVPQHDPLGLRV